jgi:phytoene dehydrogenase-like protein
MMRALKTLPNAIVVGAGPNGLAAAIRLAQAGKSVRVIEGQADLGGGTRTEALTLPGFRHDVCAAIHPLGAGSPFFKTLPLDRFGLEFIQPQAPLAHPLDGGRAITIERSLEATAAGLGPDGLAYARLMRPLVTNAQVLIDMFVGPLRPPRHPVVMARFGLQALRSAIGLARSTFKEDGTRATFAAIGAHSNLPLNQAGTGAFALMLGMMAHAVGWPVVRGGSQRLSEALAGYLRSLGGEIETGHWVRSMHDLPASPAVLFDVAPRPLLGIAGDRFPARYRRALERYRYGPGVFKVDWALDAPIPWQAAACSRAATVHLAGSFDELVAAERAVSRGEIAERPFVVLAQPTLFDPSRAPAGRHTGWAYCHVPNGSTVDMTARIEAQVERFAPGFRDRILERHVMSPAQLEQDNPNYVGGDINSGMANLRQLFIRPTPRLYGTPDRSIYLCGSSTPPGGGVHGMCGVFAAQRALRRVRW